ncbi:zinc finger protein ZAT1-like [Impatiens glandulifera]|uniref:zinc finger protein ZAT1-like n=1 Tax=Impatiens glandulifera TaxID=253017 RepID=UPI001FB0DA9C|nr:zinc finger protein ZAT1-like [Impatiens glandulifera]
MEEENNQFTQQIKHVCKLCNKSFLCGRSLGGHMRSHDKKPSSFEFDSHNPTSGYGYGLRENPKKTNKFNSDISFDDDSSSVEDKFCKQCGKGFFSWKALFGHMKCHSDYKRKRSRTSSSLNSEIDQEQDQEHDQEEEVAMCLMMLSRDGSGDVESSDNNYEFLLQVQKTEMKEFECSTCNKTFHSYQALGGHRASHKKIRTCFNDQELVQIAESSSISSSNGLLKKINHRIHQCPVCFKVFQTGQALGGHKRSHLMEASKNKNGGGVVLDRPPATAAAADGVFPDLNLPAPVEEEDSYQQQPWWVLV